jgi:hypothetical protein
MVVLNIKVTPPFANGGVTFELHDELCQVQFAASGDPLVQRTEAATRNGDADRLAGCWVHDGFLLQIRHLATLRFDVTVANVAAG